VDVNKSGGQRGYVLALLATLSAFNFLDQQVMAIVLEPVRREFALSDIQLGLLSGLAFAALYSTLSIPAGVWAVDHSRRNLIAAAAALWGTATILCGAAQSFTQLLLGRIGVGVGEAGGMPASQALISDLYEPERRATALGILAAGVNAGVFLAFLVGGFVAQRYGWRAAFVAAGIPPVVLAVLLRLTVREPPRPVAKARGPSYALVRETLRAIWRDPALRHLCFASTLTMAVGYGALPWIPSYLVRSHGLDIATIGLFLAVMIGLGGALGTYLGGKLADRLGRRNPRWSLWLVCLVFVIARPFAMAFYVVDHTWLALALFALPAMVGAIHMGPSFAVLHERIDARLRPISSAVLLLILNFIGLGLGPLLVGGLSQWVFAGFGEGSLRYALMTIQVVGLWGAVHYYFAGRNLGPRRT
jgi:predicted MFS family arabinose efflux permease